MLMVVLVADLGRLHYKPLPDWPHDHDGWCVQNLNRLMLYGDGSIMICRLGPVMKTNDPCIPPPGWQYTSRAYSLAATFDSVAVDVVRRSSDMLATINNNGATCDTSLDMSGNDPLVKLKLCSLAFHQSQTP